METSRDKQIEEMAKDICIECPFIKCIPCKICHSWVYAEEAFDKGYRKASEVVEDVIKSVDEMFDRQLYESQWVDENMEVLGGADTGYAYECWRDYIKAELKKKYTEGER